MTQHPIDRLILEIAERRLKPDVAELQQLGLAELEEATWGEVRWLREPTQQRR